MTTHSASLTNITDSQSRDCSYYFIKQILATSSALKAETN